MNGGQLNADDLLEALADAGGDKADALLLEALGGCLGDLALPGGEERKAEEGIPGAAAA